MDIQKPFHYSEFKYITRQIAVYIDLSAYNMIQKRVRKTDILACRTQTSPNN